MYGKPALLAVTAGRDYALDGRRPSHSLVAGQESSWVLEIIEPLAKGDRLVDIRSFVVRTDFPPGVGPPADDLTSSIFCRDAPLKMWSTWRVRPSPANLSTAQSRADSSSRLASRCNSALAGQLQPTGLFTGDELLDEPLVRGRGRSCLHAPDSSAAMVSLVAGAVLHDQELPARQGCQRRAQVSWVGIPVACSPRHPWSSWNWVQDARSRSSQRRAARRAGSYSRSER